MDKMTGTFRPIKGTRGAYTLTVLSSTFPRGGRHPLARVGKQAVTSIVPFAGGGGFTARIHKPPAEGDRLFVSYVGEPESRTDVVFRSGRELPVA